MCKPRRRSVESLRPASPAISFLQPLFTFLASQITYRHSFEAHTPLFVILHIRAYPLVLNHNHSQIKRHEDLHNNTNTLKRLPQCVSSSPLSLLRLSLQLPLRSQAFSSSPNSLHLWLRVNRLLFTSRAQTRLHPLPFSSARACQTP